MYGELPLIKNTSGDEVRSFPVIDQISAKTCALRLPTPDEILTYLSSQRSRYRDLGRRRGESIDVPNPGADRRLFEAIRLDKDSGVEWDDAEALYAINQILRHEVGECVRDGQAYRIVVKTMFGDTTHVLRLPTRKEIAEYQRSFFASRDLPHNETERRFPPEVPCSLYDKIAQSHAGYDSESVVPPHHKRAVISELMLSLSELEPSLDPN